MIRKKKNPRGAERPTPELDSERWKTEKDRVVGLNRAAEIREVTPLHSVGTHKVVLRAYFRRNNRVNKEMVFTIIHCNYICGNQILNCKRYLEIHDIWRIFRFRICFCLHRTTVIIYDDGHRNSEAGYKDN